LRHTDDIESGGRGTNSHTMAMDLIVQGISLS